MSTSVYPQRGAPVPSGWPIFVGVVLLMVGSFNVIYGLTAVFDHKVFVNSGGHLIVWNFTAWGWIHFVTGLLMVVTSLGLFAMIDWARWVAIFFAMVNAIAQIGWITVHPLWTLIVVALDLIVIHQLAARWPEEAS
jgi:hypothetical protein